MQFGVSKIGMFKRVFLFLSWIWETKKIAICKNSPEWKVSFKEIWQSNKNCLWKIKKDIL